MFRHDDGDPHSRANAGQRAAVRRSIRSGLACGVLATALVAAIPGMAMADEGGVGFWLPGFYGSLAAAPQQPGWSFAEITYHTSVSAGGDVAAAREITIGRFNPTVGLNLSGNVNANATLALGIANYTFATPVLGGQASVGMMAVYGRNDVNLNATLTSVLGPLALIRSDSFSSTATGFGDLVPAATLRWNQGVNNFMVYATADLPVGLYDSTHLANLGIGHWAVDGGVGYTYLNPQTGHEFSATTGLTYNFINPATQYQNGVDWHLDWGASQFVSKQVFIGAVGYIYQQISADSGSGDRVGSFLSRVIGVGPQVGFIFPVGNMHGYLNFKAYKEFDNENRPAGWNAWATFSISLGEQAPPPAAAPLLHK